MIYSLFTAVSIAEGASLIDRHMNFTDLHDQTREEYGRDTTPLDTGYIRS